MSQEAGPNSKRYGTLPRLHDPRVVPSGASQSNDLGKDNRVDLGEFPHNRPPEKPVKRLFYPNNPMSEKGSLILREQEVRRRG